VNFGGLRALHAFTRLALSGCAIATTTAPSAMRSWRRTTCTATDDRLESHRPRRPSSRRAEIGAAWPKRSTDGRDYLSVKLDDPSFNAPIFADLFDGDDDTYNQIWSRGGSPPE
jgi:hypothetical protein